MIANQPYHQRKSSLLTTFYYFIYGLTAWMAAASLLTFPDVIPATEILPSFVA